MKLIKLTAIAALLLSAATAQAEDVRVRGGVYLGTVTIDLGDPFEVPNQSVKITPTGLGTCDFALDNFSLSGDPSESIGNILVTNVKTTRAAGSDVIEYNGSVEALQLAEGEIVADVILEGTESTDRKVDMKIHVLWAMDPDDKENTTVPIEVYFNGTWDGTSAITPIEADKTTAEAEYYSIDGRRADNAAAPGLYIVRRGNDTAKVLVK